MLDLATLKTYLTSLGVLASTRKPKGILIFMVQNLENEIWEFIKDERFKDFYKVSTLGRVKSIRNGKERLMSQTLGNWGYVSVKFTNKEHKKNLYVHKVLAQTFLLNPKNKPQVNHINGIKTDNRIGNLEWVTFSENSLHSVRTGLSKTQIGENGPRAVLKNEDVIKIREMRANGISQNAISKKYKITASNVHMIVSGKSWKNLPLSENKRTKVDMKGELSYTNKITSKEAYDIAHNYKGVSNVKVAAIYGITCSTVSFIKNGKSWSSVTGIKKST
jgi:hypothetical protein